MAKRLVLLLLLISTMQLLQAQPPEKPALFMEGSVSTNLNERDMAIAPDGSEMYYTLQANQNAFSTIVARQKLPDGKWSAPSVASFSGKYGDLEPAFSHDGKKLYFSSNRPLSGDKLKDYDIWVVEKINDSWSNPKNLGSPVNTDANEFYPSVADNGNLYFTAQYEQKGVGKEDIYMSRWKNGIFEGSMALDTAVNSSKWEFNAFISPDEQFILFTSYGRKDDQGGGDLYISVKNTTGKWMPAKNITSINSTKLDYCPFVSRDKRTLYFTSGRHDLPALYPKPATYDELKERYNSAANGSENIYWMDFVRLFNTVK